MNLDKEISWIEEQLKERPKTEAKILGRLLEICIKVKSQGIRRPKKEKVEYKLYKEFMAVYAEFIHNRSGVGVLIDAFQGANLKRIIAYLVENAKDKTETGALEAWKYIFINWGDVSTFLQSQVSLYQIYKNLPEILDNLKNGHYKKQQNTYKKGLADLKSSL